MSCGYGVGYPNQGFFPNNTAVILGVVIAIIVLLFVLFAGIF